MPRKRTSKQLDEKQVVHIYTEGFTEEYYFKKLKHSGRVEKFSINKIKWIKLSGLKLMDKIEKSIKKMPKSDRPDVTILVFDKDALSEKEIRDCMAKIATDTKVAFSNCNFELWLLNHFERITTHHDKNMLEKKLSQHLGGIYEKIQTKQKAQIDQTFKTIDNALEHSQVYAPLQSSDDWRRNPYTNVGEMIRFLQSK